MNWLLFCTQIQGGMGKWNTEKVRRMQGIGAKEPEVIDVKRKTEDGW